MIEYKCPRCQKPCFNFKELCRHVQYDHGLWFLGKEQSPFPVPGLQKSRTIFTSATINPWNYHTCNDTVAEIGQLKQQFHVEITDLRHQNQSLLMELRSLKSTALAAGESALLTNRDQDILQETGSKFPVSSTTNLHFPKVHNSGSSSELNDLSNNMKTEVDYLNQSYQELQHELKSLKASFYAAEKEGPTTINSPACKMCGLPTCTSIGLQRQKSRKTSSVSSQTASIVADSGKGGSCIFSEEILRLNDTFDTPLKSSSKISSPMKGSSSQPSPITSSRECSASSQESCRKKKPFRTKRISRSTIPEGEEDDLHHPETVFQLVFKYLETNDLLRCRDVCRLWRHWLVDPAYWVSVTLMNCFITSKIMKDISVSCTKMRFLTLQGLKRTTQLKENDHNSNRGILEIGLESLLKSSSHSLQSVSIIDCGALLTERSLWLIGCHCPQIRQIAYISDCYPAIPESLWSLGAGCRKIHTVIVPPLYPSVHPKRFNDRCLLTIAKCWSRLKTLCIGGTEITASGLISLVASCRHLEALELDHMGEVHESVVKCLCEEGLQELQQIYLTHTPISPAAVQLLSDLCPKLQKISILIGPEDYFLHPDHDSSREKFQKKLQELKILRKDRGMRELLVIEETRPTRV